jgi:FAD-dependent urate hydroxylase
VVTERIDIAIIGAGPYGLAAAAHLRNVGRDPRVFGQPLRFWSTHTPIGMLLRSPYTGSDIGAPELKLTLQDFERDTQQPVAVPIPVDRFVEYGKWFQERAVPDLDQREVDRIEVGDSGFRLEVEGDTFEAANVVVAAGIGKFARRPPQFASFDKDLVSHTVEQRDLGIFRGRRVSVIGGGQSALESAALLHEGGADVDVLVRAAAVRWILGDARRHTIPWLNRLLYAPAAVGPAGLSQLNQRPALYRFVPGPLHDPLDRRSIRSAGAAWLVERVRDVPIRAGIDVAEATRAGQGLQLRLSDGTRQTVDHVLLGTGFRIELSKYPFWSPALINAITCVRGYPRLTQNFETTVPGLYVTGAPAAPTFGPLMRFVAGSGFAGRSIARALAR